MSLSDVAARLTQLVGADGVLALDPASFAQPGLASFRDALASVLTAVGAGRLQVSAAKVASATAVTVDGQAALFGTTPGTIHIEVTGADKLTVTLAFTAPPGWGFADGFPGLPSSYQHLSANPGLVGLGASALYDLVLASATLTATSGSADLAFAGSLADASYFTFLATALNLPAHPPLTGTIRLNGSAPATPDLVVGGAAATLRIGDLLQLTQVGLHAYTVPKDPSTGGALTRIDLDATIEAGSQDPVPIKLSAPFHGLSGVLALTADFGEAGLSIGRGVHVFAELLGLDVGSFSLPSPLDVIERFALLSITCILTTDPPGVQRLVLTVGPGAVWPIAPGVEVDNLTIGWAIAYPFDSEVRQMSASIFGTLALGTVQPKLEFDVLAFTDGGFTVFGDLTHPMTLEQIATTINGAPVTGLPQLEVLLASVTASTNGDFGVLVSLGNWPVGSVGDTPIVLLEVFAALQRQAGTIGARFLTVLGVGTARLRLSAELAMSSRGSAGWVFDGGTQPGTALDIGDLIAELAGRFGIQQVPEQIKSLRLTALNLRYDTAASHFAFTAAAGFTVDTVAVAAAISVDVAPTAPAGKPDPYATTVQGSKGYSATFKGQLTFAGLHFDIVFDAAAAGPDVLIADYLKTGPDPVELHDLVAGVSAELAQAIPHGISIGLDEVKFVFLKQTATQWAFGLRLGVAINLNELPAVGSSLPAEATLAIDNLQILYSSADLVADQTKIVNPLLPAGVAKLPDSVGKGIGFDADVKLGTTQKHLHAGVTPPAQPATPAIPPAAAISPAPAAAVALPAATGSAPVSASSTDPVKWFDVNKQFGIFSFERIGVGYQDNALEFALDASVALGPLAFSMQALTVGSSLTKFKPEFGLKGLALTFDRPPIDIGGALLKVSEPATGKDAYYGELIVQAATFSLKALGGWAPDIDPTFFFIYVSIDVPLGGPPFLFVTGLAGGFGINTRLVLPTIDQVGDYPLLPGKAPPEQSTPAKTIADVVPALQRTFQPQAGDYWVAAGISFTSFEMIEARAVISVLFGVDLQIGVVGTCAMTFPTGDVDVVPVAYIEIDVVASFTPSTGLLAVDGKLSPASYLFGGFVKLTGGFAFYAWFSGAHQGDFVVSIGGYHPAFTKPDNYPVVPRLALAFSLGPIKVVGQAYFALTPSMFMVGVRMTATFEAGPIKAWFDAGVDFLIAWAPFHYEAHAWVTIGCSVDLGLFTISVQIGADLQIWGPEFGGQALVDLDVVSFTIGFGAPRSAPAPVGWSTFATNFLPPPEAAKLQPQKPAAMLARALSAVGQAVTVAEPAPAPNIVKATVTAGLISTPAGVDWVLDPDHFRILTASTIPANHGMWATSPSQAAELPNVTADYQRAPAAAEPAAAGAVPPEMLLQLEHGTATYSDSQVWAPKLNIAPMDQTDVDSYLTISLRKRDEQTGDLADYITGVTVAPQLNASNTALWGDRDQAAGANAQRLIAATLTGFAITPVPRKPDQVSDVSLEALIFGEGHSTGFGYQAPVVGSEFTVDSATSDDGKTFTIDVHGGHTASLENKDYVLSKLTDSWVTSQRSATLDELRRLGFTTFAADSVDLSRMAQTALTDWPSATRIGSETWA